MSKPNPAVTAHLNAIENPRRRRDAETLIELMARATGEQAELRGTIIGFGNYHYKYESGREGDAAPAAFASRKANTVVYLLDGINAHTEQLERLGPHKTGVGCLYLTDLAKIDLEVLEEIVASAYANLTGTTYRKRARDDG